MLKDKADQTLVNALRSIFRSYVLNLLPMIDTIQRGRITEAEAEFERLLGASHVKSAVAELSKSDRGDDSDSITISELLYGRHFRGRN